jgi:hypothetical protein
LQYTHTFLIFNSILIQNLKAEILLTDDKDMENFLSEFIDDAFSKHFSEPPTTPEPYPTHDPQPQPTPEPFP